MTKYKFISELNDAYKAGNKLRAVILLFDTKAVGKLRESKEFIEEHWYPKAAKSAGFNVWDNLTLEQKEKIKNV